MGSLCSKLPLGSLCSKSSNHTGAHVVLSDTTNGSGDSPSDLRIATAEATAEAAERRLQEANKRGVVDTNPRKGQLAKKLADQKQGTTDPQFPVRQIYD